MNMNEYNATIAERLIAAIRDFERGRLTLDEVQAALQNAWSLFENDGSGVADAVRRAEADLEGIRFTFLRDEQRPAAIFRLDELQASIEDAIGGTGDQCPG